MFVIDWSKPILYILLAGVSCSSQVEETTLQLTMHPIGWVEKTEQKTRIVVNREFQAGLLGLNDFSHLYVLYWFDRNDNPAKRSVLQVHPRGNPQNPITGVFATRSPARPNLIALSLCKIVDIQDNVIEIDTIDALPKTPVIDLKPYIPHLESKNAVVPSWISRKK
jgi:tRNA-Thr(GGU) m(6)t(6)A37 methyltransferase TsaA